MGEYKSLNGNICSITGSNIVLGEGYEEVGKKIRILFTSYRNAESNAAVTIYHTNQPCIGGVRAPEDYDEINSLMVNKYLAALRSYPNMECVIREMDEFLDDLLQLAKLTDLKGLDMLQPSLSGCIHNKWKSFTQAIVARNGAVSQNLEMADKLSGAHIGQIVETYLLKRLSIDIRAWMKNKFAEKLHYFQVGVVKKMAGVRQGSFGVRQEFQFDQSAAITLLTDNMPTASAPVDKLLIMKQAVQQIQETVAIGIQSRLTQQSRQEQQLLQKLEVMSQLEDIEFSSDDLFSILLWVIIQASQKAYYEDLFLDIIYCREFHFGSSSTSPIAYWTCHFEVALEWFANVDNVENVLHDETLMVLRSETDQEL